MRRMRPATKEVEFDRAPFGVTGFETALALALELVHSGRLSLMRMVELFTTGPARVLGRKRRNCGRRAGRSHDLLHRPSLDVSRGAIREQIRNTPFDGRKFRGAPMVTIVGGRIAYRRDA